MGLKRDWKASKGFHGLLSTLVSRAGMRFSLTVIPYLHLPEFQEADPEKLFRAYAFKAGGAEKVGVRDAKVVSYRLGRSDEPPKSADDEDLTVWLDSETLLPLKRVWAPMRSGLRITEIYKEFRLDPVVDAKVFELPSAKAYKSPAELFAKMPREAFPEGGERGTGARKSAGEWLDSQVRDRQIEMTAIIHGVSIGKEGEQRTADISLEGIQGNFVGQFPVRVGLKEFSGRVTGAWYWGKPFPFGTDQCQTVIEPGSIRIGPIDSATAEKLRALRGNTATLRATITGCQFGVVPDGGPGPPLFCRLNVTYASINGEELPFQERAPEDKVPVRTKKKY